MFVDEHNEDTIRLIDKPLFEEFCKKTGKVLDEDIRKYEDRDMEYSMKVSSVFSSNIEGNPIDLNSYMRISASKSIKLKKDKSVKEIDDLKTGYEFAMDNDLTMKNFLEVHKIISKDLKFSNTEKGKWRIGEEEAIYDEKGIVYIAVETKYVKEIMEEFWKDMQDLSGKNLDIAEAFYLSSLIHLVFEKIHPFRDGNGRMGRLLQKWFLKRFLGDVVWKIPFESYYAKNVDRYYENLDLGPNFYDCDYGKALPFLMMAVECVRKG